MDSILNSIKKMLGLEEDYKHFDEDIIMHINAILMTLSQLGVGPVSGFTISDSTTTWSDFLGPELLNYAGIKSYVYLKVRMMFDPPTSSAVLTSMTNLAHELEWRLGITAESLSSIESKCNMDCNSNK